ncbi:MAG: sulfate adenylyltransferase subunit CysN [Spirochaetaceae bacterium]|nr:MAG: sulfate adenylyltransferase subunit CysN [Spirochaetaceae bacterium]
MGKARANDTTPTTLVKERDLLRFTTAGSVDDGKSTLIGRMLFDSKQIFQDQMDQLEHSSKLRGEENVNLALLTDGLRAEREQGITIDVAYRYFSTARRKFIIADTPGHEQYTRNMVTGASTADLAIILIDARNGVLTQSRRHGIIASLLGIPHIVVCVNKMDLVDYSRDRFDEIVAEYQAFAQKLNVHDLEFIPVSALVGDNVVNRSEKTPWFDGAPLLQFLETVTISADRNLVDFRFPVQFVVRPHQDFRGFSGQIVSGTIKVGEEIVALPSMQRSRVRSINFYKEELQEAIEGESVIITLEDEIDISRGDMIVRRHNIPEVEHEFEATLAWMDERSGLARETNYILQHTTNRTQAQIDEILYQLDVNTLHRNKVDTLNLNEIGRVKVTTAAPLFFDPYDRNRNTGGFILIDPADFRTVGAGMIRYSSRSTIDELKRDERSRRLEVSQSTEITWDPGLVGPQDRIRRNGHRPFCLWLTGLSGSGKSTLAKEVEKRLFDEGLHVVRLDGDNVRHGLNGDLGFNREDRRENIRRIGHVARLLYDFGHAVLCTFISPYEEERSFVRSLFPEGSFLQVYVRTSLAEAERRDPKGLYKKARAGEIRGFTGVDDPYQEPEQSDLVVDTERLTPEEAVEQVLSLVHDLLK